MATKMVVWVLTGALSLSVFGAGASSASLPPGCTAADRESVRLDTDRFTIKSPLEICDVPLKGWDVLFPLAPNANKASSGITVEESKAVVGGKELPALVITCKKGTFTPANDQYPVIELPMKFDASKWNILSFLAKIETTPKDLGPIGFGMDWPRYGLAASFYAQWVDGFGVAIQDQYFDWAGRAVPTTYFPYHHVRRDDKGLDGFRSFQWDMEHDDISCNKKPILTQVRCLRFFYDTLKLKDRESVKITIVNLRLVKGAETKVGDAARYIEWKNWVRDYEPDYSDSSKYLLPPETGRLAKPVQLAKDGKALVEVVVDLSDKVKIDNWVPEKYRSVELNCARGMEFAVASDAANELKLWLDKITGADFPVRTYPSDAKCPRIWLGASFAAPYFKKDIEKLAAAEAIDGYAVREKNGDIYIFGATPPGTLNGVYAFLENNSDWILAFNNRTDDPEQSSVYTVNPNLTAIWGDCIDIPVFISRGFSGCSQKFLKRLRNYYYFPCGGHILAPQYYDHSEGCRRFNPILFGETEKYQKWSEYRSLVCMNEDGWDEYMAEWMYDKRFDQITRFAYMDGLDDNYGYCTCEKCTAPFVGMDGRTITTKDFNDFWSTWLFRHYNKLADERAARWPGYESGGFCYFLSAPKPAIEVSKNYKRPWICTYVRKSQSVPIFAPINQHWWQYYKDWTAHSPNCHLYDYYFLFAKIHPISEILRFDLRGMRDFHFLRIMSEGCGSNEYMGLADERWCVSRLYWNPDADLEQLHRYFNRRVYHEAAPWIDKFRGEIRKAWFKRFKQDIEFEGTDVCNMIREFGMEKELRGYLEEAYKVVSKPGVNPKSKFAVMRMCQEFVKYMNDGKLTAQNTIPGVPLTFEQTKKDKTAVAEKVKVADPESNVAAIKTFLAGAEADPTELSRRRRVALSLYAKSGNIDEAQALLRVAKRDQRDPRGVSYSFIRDAAGTLSKLIENNAKIDAKRAIAYLDELGVNFIDEAIGWMTRDGRQDRQHLIRSTNLAPIFTKRGDPDTGAAILTHYRDIDAKGPRCDWVDEMNDTIKKYWDEVVKILNGKIAQDTRSVDSIKKELARPGLKPERATEQKAKLAEAEKKLSALIAQRDASQAKANVAMADWNASLAKTLTQGMTRTLRGNAKRQILWNEWDSISESEKATRLNALIADKWASDQIRRDCAKKIIEIYTRDGKTDWERYANHVFYAITLGNWSHAAEFVTRQNRDDDYRLDFVIDAAKKMAAAGEKKLAHATLRRAGDYLDYKAGNERNKPYNFAPKQFLKRLERYNKAFQDLNK